MDQLFFSREGQRCNEHGPRDAEDRDVGADAEGVGEDGGGRRGGRAAQLTHGEREIAEEMSHVCGPVMTRLGRERARAACRERAEGFTPIPAARGAGAETRGDATEIFLEVAERELALRGIDAEAGEPGCRTRRRRRFRHRVSNRSSRPSTMPRNAR